MEHLNWERFLNDARSFIKISDEIDDLWAIIGDQSVPGAAYLRKIRLISDCDRILRWEYHVCFSLSYGVPVMYFNVSDEAGCRLPLTELWKLCRFERYSTSDMYSVLTQLEHPVLSVPYFALHPCRTHEIIYPIPEDSNVVVKFISSIGGVVGVDLDLKYGKTID